MNIVKLDVITRKLEKLLTISESCLQRFDLVTSKNMNDDLARYNRNYLKGIHHGYQIALQEINKLNGNY